MIAVGDRRDGCVGLSSRPQTIQSEPGLEKRKTYIRERNGSTSQVHPEEVCAKRA